MAPRLMDDGTSPLSHGPSQTHFKCDFEDRSCSHDSHTLSLARDGKAMASQTARQVAGTGLGILPSSLAIYIRTVEPGEQPECLEAHHEPPPRPDQPLF